MKNTTNKIIVYGLIILSLMALVFLARVKPAHARLSNPILFYSISNAPETDPIWSAFLLDPVFSNLTTTNFFATNTLFINATTTNLFSTTASSTNLFSSLLTVGGTGLVVDASKNVAIGFASPANKLDVNGSLALNTGAFLGFVGNALVNTTNYSLFGNATLTLLNARAGGSIGFRIGNADVANFSTTGGFGFGSTYYNLDPGTNNMIVEGNLGVGIAVPTEKLHVAGNILATGIATTTGLYVSGASRFDGQMTFASASGTMITSTESYFTKLRINTTTSLGSLTLQGVSSLDPVRVVSSTGTQLFAVKTNGQVVVGANSLAQTGQLTIETPTTNDIALSFTNGVHYTFQLGRVAGTSGQAFIGGPGGTALNLRAGGVDRIFILSTNGYVGVNSSTPSTQFVVVGTTTLNGHLSFTTAIGTGITTTNAQFNKLNINTTTDLGTVTMQGSAGVDPIRIVSSSAAAAQMLALKANGQLVVGPNSLAQTGQFTIETPTTNDIALSFTDGTNYTFQLGRVPGTSGQAQIGGPSGTSLYLLAGGLRKVAILNSNGFVGVNTSTPAYQFVVSGTVAFPFLNTNITGDGVCKVAGTGELTDAGAAACIPSALKYKTNISLYEKSATALFVELVKTGAVSNYELKDKLGDPRKGLIADNVEKVDPDLVGYSADGSVNTLHFEDITGLSVKAIAELDGRLSTVEKSKNGSKNLTDRMQWGAIAFLGIGLFLKRK